MTNSAQADQARKTIRPKLSLTRFCTEAFFALAQKLNTSLISFCDLACADEKHLTTYSGDYATVIKIDGLRKIATGQQITQSADALRLELSAAFREPGHALQFSYETNPDRVHETLHSNILERQRIARHLNLDFADIFSEREKILTPLMREETVLVVAWTRKACLNRQELARASRGSKVISNSLPPLGDTQDPSLQSPDLASIHESFVRSLTQMFSNHNVSVKALGSVDGLRALRHTLYPDHPPSEWTPITMADTRPDRLSDDEHAGSLETVLWPPLREQLFTGDAITPNLSTARLGIRDWSSVDLTVMAESPRPFTELTSRMATQRTPWRCTTLIEGIRPGYMQWKSTLATLFRFGANIPIFQAFEELKTLREQQTDTIVKTRTTFATSAPAGDQETLLIRQSQLQQAITGWGGSQASRTAGDPLAGVLSAMPGLSIASTAPPTAGPLSDILTMMPWARPGRPWEDGAVLFRAADGTLVPFDPAGSGRDAVLDLWVAPSRRGKSVHANATALGLILSNASSGSLGYKLPLYGKIDIGDAASGMVDLIRTGLRKEEQHLALHIPFQLIEEHQYNVFDTEACCRKPLRDHRTFLNNFLSLVVTPPGGQEFEGMHQLVLSIIDIVYEMTADSGPSVRPKRWRKGAHDFIDQALATYRLAPEDNTPYYKIADLFAAHNDFRMAGLVTRLAVPVMNDLISAARDPRVKEFDETYPTGTNESLLVIFRRYITDFIARFPTLCKTTRLDVGDARIVVVDVDRVAPEGQGQSQSQTELMIMLAYRIISRKFFLSAEDARDVPDHVRAHHLKQFTEYREAYKRLECDEFQRTAGAPRIQKQFEDAARRSAKLGVRIGLASQKLADFGEYLISHSTGRFILGAGDDAEESEIARRFSLSTASQQILKHALTGPRADGSGAPFLMQMRVNNEIYELFLLNLLGPVELWALSTTPDDTALRRRLYDALGPAEARRRLALIFPKGSATQEIDRRKERATKTTGDEVLDAHAQHSVIDALADELINARGLGAPIREVPK